jgi:hypothetical protein
MKQYALVASKNDPELACKLPRQIIKDLVLRAEENGRSIEVEIAMRLARSLERDQEMLVADNQLAAQAFDVIEALLKNK